MPISLLPLRGVVELAGVDRVGFLQGLVSNDVTPVAAGRCVWAALLTPQGKWLADFFIFHRPDALLLECERAAAPMLVERLGKFRLRSKIGLRDASAGFAVVAGWSDAAGFPRGVPPLPHGVAPLPHGVAPFPHGVAPLPHGLPPFPHGVPPMPEGAAPDPRLPGAGWRGVMQRGDWPLDEAGYDRHRLALGLPEPADMRAEQSVLLEAGFDELHGISWEKGCYMGQELTARTKYRGLVKRRLVPVEIAGPLPAPGTAITLGGEEVGEMRSGRGQRGLALLRLPAIGDAGLACGNAVLTAAPPPWLVLR